MLLPPEKVSQVDEQVPETTCCTKLARRNLRISRHHAAVLLMPVTSAGELSVILLAH